MIDNDVLLIDIFFTPNKFKGYGKYKVEPPAPPITLISVEPIPNISALVESASTCIPANAASVIIRILPFELLICITIG